MPISTTSKLPIPKDAYEFESITSDVLNVVYPARRLQRYGRQGQNQHGIDVRTIDKGDLIVAQCKDYKKIKPQQICEIVKGVDTRSEGMRGLKKLIIAVAAERDTHCQDEVSKINNSKDYSFEIDIMFWDDFTKYILETPSLLSRYYPDYAYAQRATNTTFFVKIFVSSEYKPDTKFEKIRLELKQRLRLIPFVKSFFTEIDATASSSSKDEIEQNYIDGCDYCVFMIDNANPGISDVGKHYKRAQGQNKKCFFVFCDELSKDKSYIQSEQEQKGNLCQTIHSFDEFPEEVYYALLNDIARIYHCYAQGRLVDLVQLKDDENASDVTSSDNINISSKGFFLTENKTTGNRSKTLVQGGLNKRFIRELPESVAYLYKFVTGHDYYRRKIQETSQSELDKYCNAFLKVLTHQKGISEFDVNGLLGVVAEKISGDNNFLEDIIKIRWDAIVDFYTGRADKCLKSLNNALDSTVKNSGDNSGLSIWFIHDLMIDLRNVDTITKEEKSFIPYSEKYQAMLDESPSLVVYPGIDRGIKDFYQTINERQNRREFEKPGTINVGDDIAGLLEHIVQAMAVAMCYGSLTYLILFDCYMRDLFIYLAKRTGNWKYKIDSLKYTVSLGSKQDLDRMVNSWNDILAKINEREVKSVFDHSQASPYKCRKFRRGLNVFEFLGYYFSDEDYKDGMNSLLARIDEWMKEEQPSTNYCTDVCKFLQNNVVRMGSDKVAEYFIRMSSADFRLNVDVDAYKILQSVRFEELSDPQKIKFYEILLDAITVKPKTPGLAGAIINYRVSLKEDVTLLERTDNWEHFDKLVCEKLPGLRGDYLLEINRDEVQFQMDYIKACSERIRADFNSKSKNAILMIAGDDYLQLLNLLKYDGLLLEGNDERVDMKLVFNVLLESARNDDLYLENKRNAFLGMMVICQRVVNLEAGEAEDDYDYFIDSIDSMCSDIDIKDVNVFGRKSLGNMTWYSSYWAFLLLSLSGNSNCFSNCFTFASRFSSMNDTDRVSVIEAVSIWSQYFDGGNQDKSAENGVLQIIVGMLISAASDRVFGVRKYAVKALMNLIEKNIADFMAESIIIALSERMDNDLPSIKCMILSKQHALEKYDSPLTHGIVEKGKIDSNYIVRNRDKLYW